MQQRRSINAVRQRPVLAIILTLALIASGLAAGTQITRTQGEGIGPVAVSNESASFDSGANVLVDDPAISAQGEGDGPRTVKEFTRESPFSMFALTWQGDRDVTAFVRGEQGDGTWTEWFGMEPIAANGTGPGTTNGTDLIFLGDTTRIQVSTHGVELFPTEEAPAEAPAAPAAEYAAEPVEQPTADAPAETGTDGLAPLPSNYGDIQPVADTVSGLDAVFIDGNADAGVGIDLVADTDGMPKVISRSGWGADESLRCRQPTIDDGVSAITIHHTAGSNNYTQAESAAQMRGYYNYHAKTLGWCDIGYHALVDKYGTIYEGRFGGLTQAVQGAHAGGFNQNTWAISMMGDYSTVQPSSSMIQSVGFLAGWRSKVASFDPTGSDTHYSEGSSYTFVPAGQAKVLPNIFAHRDVGSTSCPGNAGYAQMGTIRSIAKSTYDSLLAGGTTDAGQTTGTDDGQTTTTPTTTAQAAAPTTTPVAQEPASGDPAQLLNTLLTGGSSGGTELLNGASNEQILSGLGSIAAIAVGAAVSQGTLQGAGSELSSALDTNNGVPVIRELKLSDIIPVAGALINLSGNNQFAQAWNEITGALGPVLGNATGGATTVRYTSERNSEVSYVPFENGILVSSPEAGTHGLWGAIGDTWTQQGADLGPLGLPINNEYRSGELLRVDFQGGHITFNPNTGATSIQLN